MTDVTPPRAVTFKWGRNLGWLQASKAHRDTGPRYQWNTSLTQLHRLTPHGNHPVSQLQEHDKITMQQ